MILHPSLKLSECWEEPPKSARDSPENISPHSFLCPETFLIPTPPPPLKRDFSLGSMGHVQLTSMWSLIGARCFYYQLEVNSQKQQKYGMNRILFFFSSHPIQIPFYWCHLQVTNQVETFKLKVQQLKSSKAFKACFPCNFLKCCAKETFRRVKLCLLYIPADLHFLIDPSKSTKYSPARAKSRREWLQGN